MKKKEKRKRVALTLSLSNYEKLLFTADKKNIPPSTLSSKLVSDYVQIFARDNGHIDGCLSENDLFSDIDSSRLLSSIEFTKKKRGKRNE